MKNKTDFPAETIIKKKRTGITILRVVLAVLFLAGLFLLFSNSVY